MTRKIGRSAEQVTVEKSKEKNVSRIGEIVCSKQC